MTSVENDPLICLLFESTAHIDYSSIGNTKIIYFRAKDENSKGKRDGFYFAARVRTLKFQLLQRGGEVR